MAPTATVWFNVGGTRFDVSKSLLDQHSQCVLARMIADEWKDEEHDAKPLFVDRSPTLFEQVLSFMRDGSVSLPPTVSNEAFKKELIYYNIDCEVGSVSAGMTSASHFVLAKRLLLKKEHELGVISASAATARDIVKMCLQEGDRGAWSLPFHFHPSENSLCEVTHINEFLKPIDLVVKGGRTSYALEVGKLQQEDLPVGTNSPKKRKLNE